jgi:tRNA (guanine37-N1)-methyltransferase
MSVPDILLSGNHAAIARWRLEQRKLRTEQRRPDLWKAHVDRKSEI